MFKNRNLAILFFTLVVIMMGFGMIIPILPFLVEKIGGGGIAMGSLMGDVTVVKASLFASIFGFLLMLTAYNLATVILMTSLFILSNAMLRPAVSSLISKRTDTGQGAAMGLNNSFMSLGRVVGPLWAGAALDTNLKFPFMTGSLVMQIGFVTSLFHLGSKTEPANTAASAIER